jgi:hypothetical protein
MPIYGGMTWYCTAVIFRFHVVKVMPIYGGKLWYRTGAIFRRHVVRFSLGNKLECLRKIVEEDDEDVRCST